MSAFVRYAVTVLGAFAPDAVLGQPYLLAPGFQSHGHILARANRGLSSGFVRQARGQIPIAEPADRGSVQQGFYDAFKIGVSPGIRRARVAETSLLCDVSKRALLSHIPSPGDCALRL